MSTPKGGNTAPDYWDAFQELDEKSSSPAGKDAGRPGTSRKGRPKSAFWDLVSKGEREGGEGGGTHQTAAQSDLPAYKAPDPVPTEESQVLGLDFKELEKAATREISKEQRAAFKEARRARQEGAESAVSAAPGASEGGIEPEDTAPRIRVRPA
jgi:hypothetical protein